MSTENLLRPRYKTIIKTPHGPSVGTILEKHKYASGNWYVPNCMYNPDDYPEVFKKLEWWEERKLEEMPEYVKVIREDCIKNTGLYCKVFRWTFFDDKFPTVAGQYGAELEGYTPLYLVRTELNFAGQVYGRLNAFNLQPATLTEYETYINQKEKQ